MRHVYTIKRPRKIVRETVQLILARKDFTEDVIRLRQSFQPLIDHKESRKSKINSFLNGDGFYNRLMIIKEKYGLIDLLDNWDEFLTKYILYNEVDKNFDPEALTITQEWLDELDIKGKRTLSPETKFTLRLYPSTTLRDITHAWPTIKKVLTKGVRTKLRPSKKFNRDLKFMKLADRGESVVGISTRHKIKNIGVITKAVSRIRNKAKIPKRIRNRLNTE